MTSSLFPAGGSRVEMDTGDERLGGVRVVRVTDAAVTLSLALDDVPPQGSTVILRWPAGIRGLYAVRAAMLSADENRVDFRLLEEPAVEQRRNFVRGGGGEDVLLVRPGRRESIGRVHDISERSVRAHFTDVDLRPGQEMRLRVQLGGEVVEFPAIAMRVSAVRQQVPFRGPLSVEMVAIFEQDERQAKIIRRYVLRQQVARAREAAAAAALTAV
ncbi:hypothetical protein AB0M02_08505 [Actinoplanes sp. NPDC051861]|uniref:hypothetical protein n=1 Tax=Actinoplanes sp. NPDC051861 TaxID=3155170 RepID=UPI0034446928